jgi:hypothetical protein
MPGVRRTSYPASPDGGEPKKEHYKKISFRVENIALIQEHEIDLMGNIYLIYDDISPPVGAVWKTPIFPRA